MKQAIEKFLQSFFNNRDYSYYSEDLDFAWNKFKEEFEVDEQTKVIFEIIFGEMLNNG